MSPSGKRKKKPCSHRQEPPVIYPAFLMARPGLVCPVSDPGWLECGFREQRASHENLRLFFALSCDSAQDWYIPISGTGWFERVFPEEAWSQNKSRDENLRLFVPFSRRLPARPAEYENWGRFECFSRERCGPPDIISPFAVTRRTRAGGYEQAEKRGRGGGGRGTRTRFLLLRLSVLTLARLFFLRPSFTRLLQFFVFFLPTSVTALEHSSAAAVWVWVVVPCRCAVVRLTQTLRVVEEEEEEEEDHRLMFLFLSLLLGFLFVLPASWLKKLLPESFFFEWIGGG